MGWLPPADHLVEKDEQLSLGWMPPADHLIEQHEQADNCCYLWDGCLLQIISYSRMSRLMTTAPPKVPRAIICSEVGLQDKVKASLALTVLNEKKNHTFSTIILYRSNNTLFLRNLILKK